MGDFGADPALVASQSSQQAVSTKGFDPGELEVLAERCEQATGPNKRIDLTIFATLHPDEFADAAEARQYASASYQREMNNADWYYISTIGLPRYIASLDAAMTLVPEGFRLFSLGEARYMTRSPAYCAQLEIWTSNDGVDGSEQRSIGVAATAPLALCAAALRARAASQDTPSPPEDM